MGGERGGSSGAEWGPEKGEITLTTNNTTKPKARKGWGGRGGGSSGVWGVGKWPAQTNGAKVSRFATYNTLSAKAQGLTDAD